MTRRTTIALFYTGVALVSAAILGIAFYLRSQLPKPELPPIVNAGKQDAAENHDGDENPRGAAEFFGVAFGGFQIGGVGHGRGNLAGNGRMASGRAGIRGPQGRPLGLRDVFGNRARPGGFDDPAVVEIGGGAGEREFAVALEAAEHHLEDGERGVSQLAVVAVAVDALLEIALGDAF